MFFVSAGGATETKNMTFPFQKMDAYQVAKEIARRVHAIEIGNAEVKDQARRASVSVFLQLSEGLPDDRVKMRRRYFGIARNSLAEVVAAIDLGVAIGAIEQTDASELSSLAYRLRGMLVALLR